MEKLISLFNAAQKKYSQGKPHQSICLDMVAESLSKLKANASLASYGSFKGNPDVAYSTFESKNDNTLSRPMRPELFILDKEIFRVNYDLFIATLKENPANWKQPDRERAIKVCYTSVMSVACCYDLWKRSSRKSPGTFFEFFIAGVIQSGFEGILLSKHIPLLSLIPDDLLEEVGKEEEAISIGEAEHRECVDDPIQDAEAESAGDVSANSISTDLVISVEGKPGGIVVPLKITTRERIVQPFAHQRILDSAFGVGRFISMIVCISETQLDTKSRSVKQVCVPGTIELFQKYLASIQGLYYCDVPQRYAASDVSKFVNVASIDNFFETLWRRTEMLKGQAKTD